MEIKTNRAREIQNKKIVPSPDRARHRRRTNQRMGKNHIPGRRFISVLRSLGKCSIFLMMIAFVLSIFVFTSTSDKFHLRGITFHGCRELDPKQLESIVRQESPASILRINLLQIKNRLEQETWVKGVEIRRVLPSDLVIDIQERIPSVILEMNGTLMVADRDGTLLGEYDPRFGKLDVPVFRGVLGDNAEGYRMYQEENAARIRQGLIMLTEIEAGWPEYAREISEVDIADRSNLKIMLVNDTHEIYLGEKDYLRRIRKFMNNLSEYEKLKEQYNEFASIDLRYDREIIYKLRRSDNDSLHTKTARLENSRQRNP